MVGDIKTAPLKDYGNGVDNTASLAPAFGTNGYWFFIKPLFPFKVITAIATLILIDRHILHPELNIKVV